MKGIQRNRNFRDAFQNFDKSWEPIIEYLNKQREEAGWSKPDVEKILNSTNKTQHFFTRSHFNLINKADYTALYEASNKKYFCKDYDELKDMFDESRAYFNNTHDNFNNVWHFDRAGNDERIGHATPKPIALCERAIKSSCPENGIVLDWFCGSGSTAIACIKTKRSCYTCDISEHYTQVSVKRCIDFMDKNNIEYEITLNGENFDVNKLYA
jgi:DNA modification methylase